MSITIEAGAGKMKRALGPLANMAVAGALFGLLMRTCIRDSSQVMKERHDESKK